MNKSQSCHTPVSHSAHSHTFVPLVLVYLTVHRNYFGNSIITSFVAGFYFSFFSICSPIQLRLPRNGACMWVCSVWMCVRIDFITRVTLVESYTMTKTATTITTTTTTTTTTTMKQFVFKETERLVIVARRCHRHRHRRCCAVSCHLCICILYFRLSKMQMQIKQK